MKEIIVLKSTHPDEYPDLAIECRVIPNDEIGAYLDTIPEEKKFYAYKTGKVAARFGKPGEEVKTTLKTVVDGREYILSEEEDVVREREIKAFNDEVTTVPDIVVTNISSTSNEEYIVKYEKFLKTYTPEPAVDENGKPYTVFAPTYDSRLLTQVDENVIIMTAWGAPAICLAGSYIVTYDTAINDYNTLEQGAYLSTYTVDESPKTLKKQ